MLTILLARRAASNSPCLPNHSNNTNTPPSPPRQFSKLLSSLLKAASAWLTEEQSASADGAPRAAHPAARLATKAANTFNRGPRRMKGVVKGTGAQGACAGATDWGRRQVFRGRVQAGKIGAAGRGALMERGIAVSLGPGVRKDIFSRFKLCVCAFSSSSAESWVGFKGGGNSSSQVIDGRPAFSQPPANHLSPLLSGSPWAAWPRAHQ